jgi:hypothetical protein
MEKHSFGEANGVRSQEIEGHEMSPTLPIQSPGNIKVK